MQRTSKDVPKMLSFTKNDMSGASPCVDGVAVVKVGSKRAAQTGGGGRARLRDAEAASGKGGRGRLVGLWKGKW